MNVKDFTNEFIFEFKKKICKLFEIDLRALVVLRVAFGFILFYDLITRFLDIKTFFSDDGLFPRVFLYKLAPYKWSFSLMSINGSLIFQIIFFFIAFIFVFLFMAGYKTKITSIILWIIILSIQNRNPFLNYGADNAIIAFLFWMMFLPLGYRFSASGKSFKTVSNLATFAYFIQIATIYFITAVAKSGKEWCYEGSAVFYALNMDSYATGLGIHI